MGFLNKLFGRQQDAGPTILVPHKMSLEERMAWRRDTLYKSVRECFSMLEVVGAMYKFKVSKMDDRGHHYLVMVDIGRDFTIGKRIKLDNFADLEEFFRKQTFEKYGIVITAMYWRSKDSIIKFKPIPKQEKVVIKQTKEELEHEMADTKPMVYNSSRQQLSSSEIEAFRNALREGLKPPPIHIGNKEYQSDLAPLTPMEPEKPSGTQYGDLIHWKD